MSNERLRAAITASGRTLVDVGERVQVDPKTVERWVTAGRTPHRRHRLALASLLGEGEAFLWPETTTGPRVDSASQAEFVTLYPNRGSVGVETWTSLLDTAEESIDLLAFAGSFLHDAIPDFGTRVVEAARRGVQVRLMFGDPESEAVRLRGDEEGIGDLMSARCRLTWKYLEPIVDEPGVLARRHGSTLYNSLFRFDGTLMANVHTLGAPASHSPVLHLRRIAGGRLFTHYMQGFDRTWDSALPVEATTAAA